MVADKLLQENGQWLNFKSGQARPTVLSVSRAKKTTRQSPGSLTSACELPRLHCENWRRTPQTGTTYYTAIQQSYCGILLRCVYVFMSVCMCVCMYVCMHARAYNNRAMTMTHNDPEKRYAKIDCSGFRSTHIVPTPWGLHPVPPNQQTASHTKT